MDLRFDRTDFSLDRSSNSLNAPMKIPLIGSCIHAISYQDANEKILNWVLINQSRYVCAANVHMIMEAWDDPGFKEIINNADMVTPDGMPLVWMLRLKGSKDQQRVYGPTLMLRVLDMAARENIPVGFYGGRPEVLEVLIHKMLMRYPGLSVVYSYSPPFRELTSDEDIEIISCIKDTGVKILFVGLGCPKQERWMALHLNRFSAVMIGVGAAFDFHAGVVKQAPGWMQKAGLEWLFRFLQEPGRLWKRYLIQNPRFVVLAFADLLSILKIGKN